MTNPSDKISEMFLKVYNNPINHNNCSETFPCECFGEVCIALSEIKEIVSDRHIDVEVKMVRGLCRVKFVYFSDESRDKMLPFEEEVREKFKELL